MSTVVESNPIFSTVSSIPLINKTNDSLDSVEVKVSVAIPEDVASTIESSYSNRIVNRIVRYRDLRTNSLNEKTLPSFLIPQEKVKSEFDKVSGTLISYLNLQTGWDGYNGVVPSIESVQSCLRLLQKLRSMDVKAAPKSMLSGSGEVSLYWTDTTNKTHIEIGAEESSLFTYLVVSKDKTFGSDDVDLLNDFPSVLKVFINKIKSL